MDSLDEQIVQHLQDNARVSFSELGRRIGLSTNATATRVRRLEETGVIIGYRAVLATDLPEASGGLEAFVDVRLDPAIDSEDFLAWTASVPQIEDAAHVTGGYDYLLHVRARDTGALDALLRSLKRSAGAIQTQTRLALRPAAAPAVAPRRSRSTPR